MKKIVVEKNCIGCGVCFSECSYLRENAEGNAEAVSGRPILAKDINLLNKIVQNCPVNAIKIVDIKSDGKKGKDGVNEIINKFQKFSNNYTVGKLTTESLKIIDPKVCLDTPISFEESSFDYRSKSDARAAASSEFRKLCYSENAYRKLLKQYFIDYKRRVLKPYYLCEEDENSFYYLCNQKIRKVLEDTYVEVISCTDGKIQIPESWKEFSVYPRKDSRWIKELQNFEDYSTCSGIIAEWKSMPYTDIEDYMECVEYLDIDMSDDIGGLFSFLTRKIEWCYCGVNEAISKCCEDLARAILHQEKVIEQQALDSVKEIAKEFEQQAMGVLERKARELNNICKI